MSQEKALKLGFRGCVAADRIMALGPDGSVYPCSQLVSDKNKAGNILEDDFVEIWHKSKQMKKYRNFRRKRVYKESRCGICKLQEQCGGCRVFSDNTKEEDPGCPGPIVKDLKHLGKYGRKAHLKEVAKERSYISVRDYMQMYGVGQKRAVKEFKKNYVVQKVDENSTGRKKTDLYMTSYEENIQFIQDSIGYTNWGFPYATREQISEWIGESDSPYPRWLRGELLDIYQDISVHEDNFENDYDRY